MPEIKTEEILEKVGTLADEMTAWREQADKEIKTAGEVSKSTSEGIKSLEKKLEDLHVKVEKMEQPTGETHQPTKSIGEQFTESKAYKDMVASGNYESARFEVKEIISSQAASAGDMIVPQRVPGIIAPPEQTLRFRDLLAPGRTTSNAVEYVEETLFTNAAAEAAESYKDNVTSKAESAFRFDAKSASVKTYAHWVPASRQVIRDASQLQSYVNERLTYGLKLVEDQAIADAIIAAAEDYDTSLIGTLGVTDATRIDHLRAAILQARLAQYPASGIVLNPVD